MGVFLTNVMLFLTNMVTMFLTDATDTITGLDFDIFTWITDGLEQIGQLFTVFPYNILFWFALVGTVIGMGLKLIPSKR